MRLQATRLDEKALGLPNDTQMAEWAFAGLLLNRRDRPQKAFVAPLDRAAARRDELGWTFPRIRPEQEALLTAPHPGPVSLRQGPRMNAFPDVGASRRAGMQRRVTFGESSNIAMTSFVASVY